MELNAPPHPGRLLYDQCISNKKSMDIKDLAITFDYDRNELQKILEGRSPITEYLAQNLQRFGWGAAWMWWDMQNEYNLWQAKQKE